jgi:hypothetical protein
MASRSTTEAAAKLFGGLLLLGLALLVFKWALITAAILIVPFSAWRIWDRSRASALAKDARRRRSELESRAMIDVVGRCGWCGSPIVHLDASGRPVGPLDYHRPEIEEQLGAAPAR